MTITDFARKYFGPTKYAEPFITGDKIADVAEQNPSAPQSNNDVNPRNLATPECVRDFTGLVRPFFPSLMAMPGPVIGAFSRDTEQVLAHMTTSGPRTAAWLSFLGFNQYNALVYPHMMVGPLVDVFNRIPDPQAAFAQVLSLMNFAALLEPSPVTE